MTTTAYAKRTPPGGASRTVATLALVSLAVLIGGLIVAGSGCTGTATRTARADRPSSAGDQQLEKNVEGEGRRILARPVSGDNPMEWLFNVLGPPAEERETYAFQWDFGDGITQTGDVVRHVYHQPGVYTVSVDVANPQGLSAYSLAEIVGVDVDATDASGRFVVLLEAQVEYETAPPLLRASARTSLLFPGEQVQYEWSFADGNTAAGSEVTHILEGISPYRVSVTAMSSHGRTASHFKYFVVSAPTDGASTNGINPGDTDLVDPAEASTGLEADAGQDQTVAPGAVVQLDGSDSRYTGSDPVTFHWAQTAGPPVTLSTDNRPAVTFIAPGSDGPAVDLAFSLVLSAGDLSASDEVVVTVDPTLHGPDSDGDGLPDAWEQNHFGTITAFDGSDDPDGDYFDNLAEYQLGTGPNDPADPGANQALVHEMDRAIRSFWASGGRFPHAVDGTLVGWPMRKTVDGQSPALWGVDDHIFANRPVISVMDPGVPESGMSFLAAYETTGNKLYLEYALDAAKTLLSVQRDLETTPGGLLRPALERGGWIDHAVVIPDNPQTRAAVPDEIGHWTEIRLNDPDTGDVHFISRMDSGMAFDDSISTSPAMFLLELYGVIRDRDYSNDMVDPLAGVDREQFLEGARKFLMLAEGYRSNFTLHVDDFSNVYVTHTKPAKSGPHPFVQYLAQLPPDHPLRQGQGYKPYAHGGLPHMAEERERLLVQDGAKYGSRAAGKALHKQVNDHVLSRFCLFLLRYYEVTGDAVAWNNLRIQLDWLVDVFQGYGNRGWCQQYHVLDDTCAPARPWEPPAFAMGEGRELIWRLGYIEKVLEERYGVIDYDLRRVIEDAMYYLHRVVEPDEDGESVFQYYAFQSYPPDGDPSGFPNIDINDPVFSCDYYYPDDPWWLDCPAPYDQQPSNYYLIDEDANGEFVPPSSWQFLHDMGYGYFDLFMIDDTCLNDPAATDYRGCLDLNKQHATAGDVWVMERIYWGAWLDRDADEILAAHRPNQEGYWTSVQAIHGRDRTVINTGTFRWNGIGIARYLGRHPGGILDSDSDGLSDAAEAAHHTDPRYPDSDRDGARDGDEVNLHGTDPTDPASHP